MVDPNQSKYAPVSVDNLVTGRTKPKDDILSKTNLNLNVVFFHEIRQQPTESLLSRIERGEKISDTEKITAIRDIMASTSLDFGTTKELENISYVVFGPYDKDDLDFEESDISEDINEKMKGQMMKKTSIWLKIERGEKISDIEKITAIRDIMALSPTDWSKEKELWSIWQIVFGKIIK